MDTEYTNVRTSLLPGPRDTLWPLRKSATFSCSASAFREEDVVGVVVASVKARACDGRKAFVAFHELKKTNSKMENFILR